MTKGLKSCLLLVFVLSATYVSSQSFDEALTAAKSSPSEEINVHRLDSLLNTIIDSEQYDHIGKTSYILAFRMTKFGIGDPQSILKVINIGRDAYQSSGYKGYHMARFQVMEGTAHQNLGNYAQAIRAFTSFDGLDLSDYRAMEAYMQSQMFTANHYRLLGDYDLAESVLKRASPYIMLTTIKDENRKFYFQEKAIIENHKATPEGYEAAAEFAKLALQYSEGRGEIETLTQLATAEIKKGQMQTANELQQLAIEKSLTQRDTTSLLNLYNNQSHLKYVLGHHQASIDIADNALRLCRPTDSNYRFTLLENKISSAFELEKAGGEQTNLKDQDTTQADRHLESRVLYHYRLASSRLDRFQITDDSTQLSEAKIQLIITDNLQDKLTANLKTIESRQDKRTDLYALYQLGLDIAAALDDTELMYYYAEKSNNHLLFQTGKEAINSYTLREKDIIKRSLSADSLDATLLKELAAIQKEKVDRLILSEERPDLSIVPYQYLPNAIKQQSVDVFCQGRDDLYRLIISGKDRTIVNCGNKTKIQKLVDDLKAEISNSPNNTAANDLSALQDQLSNALDLTTYRLSPFIVKGQILDPIPLEILDKQSINQISYQPSLSQTTKFYSAEPFVASSSIFAPTYVDQSVTSNDSKSTNRSLAPLPHSQIEADKVRKILGLNSPSDLETESFIKALSDYDLIHYTGHAFQDDNADYSYLPLTSDVEDLVYAYQIEANRSKATMVVLNACETNTGKLISGEGTLSLSRSLIKSGARSIVSTLWSVSDQSSAQILTSFYQYLKDGQSKSKALANAKKDFLANCPDYQKHPYYWAGIVLTGDDRPLVFEHTLQARNQKILLVLLAIGLILLFASYFSRKKNT